MGTLTTAYCTATQRATNTLDAGGDMIEHAMLIGPDSSWRFRPQIAECMAKQGVYLSSPTVQAAYRHREAP